MLSVTVIVVRNGIGENVCILLRANAHWKGMKSFVLSPAGLFSLGKTVSKKVNYELNFAILRSKIDLMSFPERGRDAG